jgi:hypothetical protein
VLGSDLDGGKAARQRTARPDVLGRDGVRYGIERDQFPRANVDRADVRHHIQTIEID